MRPKAPHAREVVFELRELDLELAVGGVGVLGKDVEDDRGAVDHRHSRRRLEVALLTGGEFVVTRDEVGVRPTQVVLQLLELAGTEIAVGMGLLAVLDQLADARDPCGPQQLLQLEQLVVTRLVGAWRS